MHTPQPSAPFEVVAMPQERDGRMRISSHDERLLTVRRRRELAEEKVTRDGRWPVDFAPVETTGASASPAGGERGQHDTFEKPYLPGKQDSIPVDTASAANVRDTGTLPSGVRKLGALGGLQERRGDRQILPSLEQPGSIAGGDSDQGKVSIPLPTSRLPEHHGEDFLLPVYSESMVKHRTSFTSGGRRQLRSSPESKQQASAALPPHGRRLNYDSTALKHETVSQGYKCGGGRFSSQKNPRSPNKRNSLSLATMLAVDLTFMSWTRPWMPTAPGFLSSTRLILRSTRLQAMERCRWLHLVAVSDSGFIIRRPRQLFMFGATHCLKAVKSM